ncbi:MAG TPA: DUF6526 family protein [Bryobacteraceae bacterium]|nr:DUF6526 family protein [Bryobacteraceae bacterium]
MKEQNYANHTRLAAGFHFVLLPLLLLTLIGSGVNLYGSWGDHTRFYSAALIVVLTFCVIVAAVFARVFALMAQDRAIKAEENFRHYLLTGKPLDPRITVRQIIGLRFASDEEFPALAAKAAEVGTSEDDIKKSVKNWRADHYRV